MIDILQTILAIITLALGIEYYRMVTGDIVYDLSYTTLAMYNLISFILFNIIMMIMRVGRSIN